MVVLRLSVVPRGRAIGLLAMESDLPRGCSGQGERRNFFSRVLICCHNLVRLARVEAKGVLTDILKCLSKDRRSLFT